MGKLLIFVGSKPLTNLYEMNSRTNCRNKHDAFTLYPAVHRTSNGASGTQSSVRCGRTLDWFSEAPFGVIIGIWRMDLNYFGVPRDIQTFRPCESSAPSHNSLLQLNISYAFLIFKAFILQGLTHTKLSRYAIENNKFSLGERLYTFRRQRNERRKNTYQHRVIPLGFHLWFYAILHLMLIKQLFFLS